MKRRDFNILEHFKNYKFYYFLKRCVFKIIIYIYKLLNFNFLKRHLFTFSSGHWSGAGRAVGADLSPRYTISAH